jgi:glycosyltransferase involved in cell wall biosynthesis
MVIVHSEQPAARTIAMLVYAFSGGAGKSTQVLLETLRGMGHRTHLITRGERVEYGASFEPVHYVEPGTPAQELRRLRAIIEKIETAGPIDLFLTNTFKDLELARPLRHPAHKHIVRVALSERLAKKGPIARHWTFGRIRRLFRGLDVVTVSRGLAQELVTVIRAKPRRVVTIYNPFDFDDIRIRAAQRDLDIPAAPFVVSVGHLVPRKRHDLVMRAFARLPGRYHLVLLGAGRLEEELRALAAELGIADRVHLPGFRMNPYAWIAAADLLVLASEFEGFGRVIVEALAVDTPAVSTRCRYGPEEILTGELAQFLVPTGDVGALYEAMSRALDSYPSIPEDSWRRFSREQSAREYLALLDGQHASWRGRRPRISRSAPQPRL